MDLVRVFDQINHAHFEGFLDPLNLSWNPRLRSSAGRFIPISRRLISEGELPTIEVATYLQSEAQAATLIADTMGHEMIHYWLWERGRPYGHTPEFLAKMQQMGVSRYNHAAHTRSYRYLYRCKSCGKDFPAYQRLGVLACAECCKQFANNQFDDRFQLQLCQKGSAAEGTPSI